MVDGLTRANGETRLGRMDARFDDQRLAAVIAWRPA
jgi:hypothetical protein